VGVFGEKFRKQRELRGLELDAISNTTKISTRMLRALEDEHFDQLPGGVFNKGFVRAYARQIGLNEEEAVADYLMALRESQVQQQSILPDFRSPANKPNPPAAPAPREEVLPKQGLRTNNNDNDDDDKTHEPGAEDRRKQGRRQDDGLRNQTQEKDFPPSINSAPQPRERFPQKYPAGSPGEPADHSAPVPWGKLALTLVVVTAALAFWNFRRRAQPQPASQLLTSTQSPASAPAAATPSPSNDSLTVGHASPEKNLATGTSSPSPISEPTTPPPANRESPTPPAPAASTPSAKPESPVTSPIATGSAKPTTSPQPEVKPPATHSSPRIATAKPPAMFTLLIRAEETTWISLAADGKPVAHETLIAPAHTSIRATHEIIVRAGNSAGISFALNGKEIPAQGNEGEVRTYTFDATGLRTTTQQQSPATNR
jgi:cytoskeletal protein RodZ